MTYIIIALIALGLVTFWLYWRKRKTSDIWKRVFAIKTKTRDGCELWLEDGVAHPDVQAIHRGMEYTFAKARCKGYTQALNISDYIVAIVKSVLSPSGVPCYKIPAGVYAGTEWDMGVYILVAGQMLTVGQPYGNIIVIPDHKGQMAESLETVVGYEVEHIVLCWNDGDEYERTKVHIGSGHPIIPDCDGQLVAKQEILCGGCDG